MKYALAALLSLVAFPAMAAVDLSLGNLVELIVYLVIVGGVLWLLLELVKYIGPPAPIAKVCNIIIMVIGVLIAINVLLGFIGQAPVKFH